MACDGFWECLLKLFNLVLTATGLAMVGYGIYLLVEWNRVASGGDPAPLASNDLEFSKLGRPLLVAMSVSSNFFDHLLEAWFILLFIGVGIVLFVISCFGCIGAVSRNGCCLSFYAFLMFLLIIAELAVAAFIFFDHSWKELIPDDKTGNFSIIYDFLDDNWKIAKWVALGAIILEGLLFVLALVVKAANRYVEYDSDDEYIAPRSTIRQPLANRQGAAATGVPVLGSFDHRPCRNDAWSQRMRDKYGLDTRYVEYDSDDEYIAPRSTIRQSLVNRQGAAATGVPVLGSFDHLPSRNDAWSQRMRDKYGLDTRYVEYDSDDEYIAPRSTIRQPLVNRQGAAATGVPVLGSFDHRPSRNDAWSQRMREKYGLDTSEFTSDPSDPSRYQQATVSQTEEKGCCTIL